MEKNHLSFAEIFCLTCFPVHQHTLSSSFGFPEQIACCGFSSWFSSVSALLPVTLLSERWNDRCQCVYLCRRLSTTTWVLMRNSRIWEQHTEIPIDTREIILQQNNILVHFLQHVNTNNSDVSPASCLICVITKEHLANVFTTAIYISQHHVFISLGKKHF